MIALDQLKMPSLSAEALEALRVMEREDADVNSVVKAVSLDPVLSATLVRYANSPARRTNREVTSVQAAVSLMGMRSVRGAIMVAAMRGFAENEHPLARMLWEQSMVLATLARSLAGRVHRQHADAAELVGMMHNIGAQVLLTNYPDRYQSMLDSARQSGQLIHEAEREVFGLHRGELMAMLGDRFRLPAVTVEVLSAYHEGALPQGDRGESDALLAMLWLAQITACRSSISTSWPAEYLPLELDVLKQQLAIDDDELLDLSEDCELLLNERFAF